jgi:hypothetical protein
MLAILPLCAYGHPAGATDFTHGFQRVDAEIQAYYMLGREVKRTPEEIAKISEQQADDDRRYSEAERQYTAERWPTDSETRCSAKADNVHPCLRIEAPSQATKGTLTPYVVTWSAMPPGTKLEIWLESTAPVGDRWRYGQFGPIQIPEAAREIVNRGSRNLAWNGKACRPPGGDVIMPCETVNPGQFLLTARATTWAATNRTQIVGWAQSEALQLDGAPDIAYLTYPWPKLRGGLGFFLPHNFFHERAMPVRRRGKQWCSTVALPPPLAGNLDVCLPPDLVNAYGIRAKPEDLTFAGNYRLVPGIIAPDRAEIIAHRLANSLFEHEVDTTDLRNIFDYEKWLDNRSRPSSEVNALKRLKFLESEVKIAIYRPVNGGYWLFEVYEHPSYFRNGEEGAPELSWETVLVKVEHGGNACVVDRRDVKGSKDSRHLLRAPAVQEKIQTLGWDLPCSQRRLPTTTQ